MSKLVKSLILKFFYPIYEKTLLQAKVGQGVAKVNYENFGSDRESDISDHLNLLNLFVELLQPSVIVELGTRGGESTRVFTRYTSNHDCQGYGVDLSPKPNWITESMNWKHFVSDDCALGNEIEKESKQIYFKLDIQDKEVPVFFKVMEKASLLQLIAYPPTQIKEEMFAEIARFLHILNKELDIPGFGMDENSKLIFYRLVLPSLKNELDEGLVRAYVNTIKNALTFFFAGIQAAVEYTQGKA